MARLWRLLLALVLSVGASPSCDENDHDEETLFQMSAARWPRLAF